MVIFADTGASPIYTRSLHDALPICELVSVAMRAMHAKRESRYRTVGELRRDIENFLSAQPVSAHRDSPWASLGKWRSEEHTSELQSQSNLVCRLLLEKKKNGRRHPA